MTVTRIAPAVAATPLLGTRALLLGDDAATRELVDVLRRRDLLGPVDDLGRIPARAAARAVRSQVAGAAGDVLDVDVGRLLVVGWRKHRDLRQAAVRTLAVPGSREVVTLTTQTVTAAHRPAVDVLVHGHRVARLLFEVALTLRVEALVAVVQDGALVEVTHGTLDVKGRLALDGVPVATRSATVPLPDWFRLRGRVVLAVPAPRTGA